MSRQIVIPRWGLWMMFIASVIGAVLLGVQLMSEGR